MVCWGGDLYGDVCYGGVEDVICGGLGDAELDVFGVAAWDVRVGV